MPGPRSYGQLFRRSRCRRCVPLVLAFVLVALALAGCRREPVLTARLILQVGPQRARFLAFEHWASRALATADRLRGPAALHEMVFAQLRGDDDVLAAWVERGGPPDGVLALPVGTQLPPAIVWQTLRDPELGPLRVASVAVCPLRLPARWRKDVVGCLLLGRVPAAGATPPRLQLTLAVRLPNL